MIEDLNQLKASLTIHVVLRKHFVNFFSNSRPITAKLLEFLGRNVFFITDSN